MKKNIIFKTIIYLILFIGLLNPMQGIAQEKVEKQFRIKMVRDINGKQTIIDTIFNDEESMKAFMASRPEPLHRVPLEKGKIEKLMIRERNEDPVRLLLNDNFMIVSPCDSSLREIHNIQVHKFDSVMGHNRFINIDSSVHIFIIKDLRIAINNLDKKEMRKFLIEKPKNPVKDDQLLLNDINCYPNPSYGKFNIRFNLKETGPVNLSITDTQGKSFYSKQISSPTGIIDEEINVLAPVDGLYILQIEQNGKSIYKKLMLRSE